jgi:hypothetical protein
LQDSFGGVLTSPYDAADRLTSRQFGGTSQTPLSVSLSYTPNNELATLTSYSNLAGTQSIGNSQGRKQGTRIGAGSTTDAIRHEMATGRQVGGRFHTQKVEEYVRALQKWLGEEPKRFPS